MLPPSVLDASEGAHGDQKCPRQATAAGEFWQMRSIHGCNRDGNPSICGSGRPGARPIPIEPLRSRMPVILPTGRHSACP